MRFRRQYICLKKCFDGLSYWILNRRLYVGFNRNDDIILFILAANVRVDWPEIKQNWKKCCSFYSEIGSLFVKLTMLEVKYTQFSPQCRNPHLKEQIRCFFPFHLTSWFCQPMILECTVTADSATVRLYTDLNYSDNKSC